MSNEGNRFHSSLITHITHHSSLFKRTVVCRASLTRYTSVMPDPANPPMGRLDAFDVGPKKLTVQTEFFARPAWRIETKIYLAGALKKVHTSDVSAVPEEDLQRSINEFHQAKIDELISGLRQMKQQ